VAHKVRIRDDAANRLIWNFALAKGAAVASTRSPSPTWRAASPSTSA
jgi:hypothetical protein